MKKGDVIIFPTDTVYGIGARLLDHKAIKKIYKIKGRDFDKPIAVLCANIEQISEFAYVTDDIKKLAEAFWPGALTLILKTKYSYESETFEKTIGVRIPNHPLALELIRKNGPLKTTSVNKSGEAPLNDYEEIKAVYNKEVSAIYPNNEKILELASTVIDLTNGLEVIREGIITKKMIEDILR
ncbi:predicted translation factor, Sua5/YciO/YrdC/YwlC domain protein [Alteracholeplasma palmae J233]|uniref:L-threonylcarbamoyladenylate synthase n=1 Tax=Alteracholeplasma palmae (strain ATCC 49389 / J233) TaxID=1318466 RepID=U4KLJ2_ALTPJ|nr:L-threonylcarbamoyladenylate synthase [Alteracholeplasma palmae]CCV64824.1 predicted translation factor, Sua5/YciO/YrdC/YwlC domain protein [Alteracholeplasma palmae J233]